jgi:putative glutamine amidotransferase
MNSILGGKLVVNLAAERPAWGAHLAPPANFLVHDLEIRPNTMLRALVKDARIVVNSLHRQGVVETGAEAVAAAVSDDGLIEALEVQRHPFFLGVQWHPEFLLSAADRDLMQGFVAASATQRSRLR